MSRFALTLLLWIFLPTLTGEADETSLSPQEAPPAGTVVTARKPDFQLNYVFSHVTFSPGPLQDREGYPSAASADYMLVPTPVATSVPELSAEQFRKIFSAVNEATQIDELDRVVTSQNMMDLRGKVSDGGSPHMVLAFVQGLRPQQFQLRDSRIIENRATALVEGLSPFGHVHGVVYLVKSEDGWKIDKEEWQADPRYVPICSFLASRLEPKRTDLMSEISPDAAINGNFLGLTPISFKRENRAIMFVFVLNKPTVKPHQDEILPGEDVDPEKPRGRVHLLWTASKKYPQEQHLITKEYPVDVSFARYNEGFAPGEWNMVLPRKKPREVDVSMLWAF